MRDVVREGTGRGAMVLGRKDLAGKTGTTNDYRDAWFSGFNSSVVTTAWVGFDQPASLGRGETGGRAALPMWIDYMRVALDGVAEQPLTAPEDVVTARVNRETGLPSDENDIDSMEEYFVKGTEAQTQGPLAEVAETPTGPGASSTKDKANEESPDATPPPQPPPDNVRKQLF
jgi:penicillin-binding protein 1A